MTKNTDVEVQAPKALLKAQKQANLLDTAIKVPLIPFRVGLDSLVGLIPGIGDAVMTAAGLRIVILGKKMGLPSALVKRMVRNVFIDFALGFIPFVGDISDMFYKSNRANVRIMEKWWVSQNKGAIDAAAKKRLTQWESSQSSDS